MSDFNTILIIGATSGLGREFARRYHARGKKIIATGRRTDRLAKLKKELSGIETMQVYTPSHSLPLFLLPHSFSPSFLQTHYTPLTPFQMDVTDLSTLSTQISNLVTTRPDLNTIIMMSGIMQSYYFSDPSSIPSLEDTTREITTNLTVPVVLSRAVLPHWSTLSQPTNLILVTSGLAYQPLPFYPIYIPTKAGVHYLCVTLRTQMAAAAAKGNKVNVIELNPPYVDTELDMHNREDVMKAAGENAVPPMPLAEYIDSAMEGLDKRDGEGKPSKEINTGFSEVGAGKWRGAYQGWLDMIHSQG